ncbi:hypothetical protein HMPREF9102_0399 [Limosilactobacillus oris F0423]|uniref:Replication terminator protein n=1 Tax=Limosilactobacillus oris F0423 TaxID=944562 RepID=A0ABN0D6H8_9LACO|nr:hypothetical protein [Limosilactobacillus oris]EGS38118.1 hypothetical protein HMPREF9102_0399 [Limosilactobacillus oris F0423]
MAKEPINFNLSEVAEGGVQVKLNRALKEVATNILNPNTEAKKKRKVTLTITVSPNDKRDAADTVIEVKTSLAPEIGVASTMLLGMDNKGQPHVNELKSGVRGQEYIDTETGEVKTDTGEKVDDVEKAEKVVDLQKRKEN